MEKERTVENQTNGKQQKSAISASTDGDFLFHWFWRNHCTNCIWLLENMKTPTWPMMRTKADRHRDVKDIYVVVVSFGGDSEMGHERKRTKMWSQFYDGQAVEKLQNVRKHKFQHYSVLCHPFCTFAYVRVAVEVQLQTTETKVWKNFAFRIFDEPKARQPTVRQRYEQHRIHLWHVRLYPR